MERRKLAIVSSIVIAAVVGGAGWFSPRPSVTEREKEAATLAAPKAPAHWATVLEAMGTLEKKLRELRSLPATSEER